jgi:hypothetical protein
MASLHPDQGAVVRDPEWLPHRYEEGTDRIHFVHAPRQEHRTATFLTDEYLAEAGNPVVIPRREALGAAPAAAPVHFIFHSAYCCSTLLARALDIEGVAMGLKEPQILNDLQGWRGRGGAPAKIAEALDGSLTLLARPFMAGEAVVIKPSNLVNALAPAMLAMRPQAKALLLYAPLPLYLASIAKKGMWGRLWVRELFVKIAGDGMLDYGFSGEEIMRQTDLQIAAIGWLGQHRQFAALAAKLGPERVRTLNSELLIARPAEAVAALADLYGLDIDASAAARIAAGPAFTSHSKGGGAFGRDERVAEQKQSAAVHAEEVEKVTIWAEAVAKSAGQSFALPSPLLP